ncbi:MAG: GAF domain-containing protein, partial [Chloroflexi bacterium]|nr:GAF domain-containing protein [Chloroflexota bacterium]
MNSRDSRPFLHPMAATTAVFLLILLALSHLFVQTNWERTALNLTALLTGLYWLVVIRFLAARFWPSTTLTYSNILVANTAIAVAAYSLRPIDVSDLFDLVVLAAAIGWDRRSALFAAATASVLSFALALPVRSLSAELWIDLGIRVLVLFVIAVLVSLLSSALTRRWKTAVTETEHERRQISRRKDELEALHDVSQAFADLQDSEAAFRLVTEQVARLIGAQVCAIAAVDPTSAKLVGVPPGCGITDEQVRALFTPSVLDALCATWNASTDEGLFAQSFAEPPAPLREIAETLQVQRFVAAAMRYQGRTIGAILAARRGGRAPFEEKERRLLHILAGQAAIGIENAHLYHQAQTNLRNITELYAVSADLAASARLADIPERVVQFIAHVLNASAAAIALANESSGGIEYAAAVGLPADPLTGPLDPSAARRVLDSGRARFVEDAGAADEYSEKFREWGFRAGACLPLHRGDVSLGVLTIAYGERHVFSSIERNMLLIFADQAAITLENARLLRAEKRKSFDLKVLASVSRALAETMDSGELLHLIEKQLRANMPNADGGVLFVYDSHDKVLVPRVSFGFDREITPLIALRPGEGLAGTVYATGAPLLLSGREAVRESRRSIQPDNLALLAAASQQAPVPQSAICSPVQVGRETIGVILIESSSSADVFASDDLHLLVAVADRVALAIRNVQLFESEQRRATQLATVNDLGHRISAILDLDDLTLTLVRLVRDKFGYRYV